MSKVRQRTISGLRSMLIMSSMLVLLADSRSIGQQATATNDALIVRMLAPELTDVQLGRMESLGQERSQKVAGLEGVGFRFQEDLDSDGEQELVLLGDYRENGGRGSFVLIARPEGGQWARSQLLTFDEDFIIGRTYDSQMAVFFCTGCDYGGRVEWTGSEYEYTPFPAPGVR